MHLEIVYTVFLGKMIFLEIKKISYALLKSDARADQNQVIFFTSPKVISFTRKWISCVVEFAQGLFQNGDLSRG